MTTGIYNVVDDFSADKTGSTDATSAIQSAFSTAVGAGGGTVVIPPGTYKLTGGLYNPGDNLHIVAHGATIIRDSASTQNLMFRSGFSGSAYGGPNNLFVEGGTWDANAANNTLNCDVFFFAHGNNFKVVGATFQNVPDWHAIELNAITYARVEDCRFRGFRLVTASRYFSEAIQMEETGDGYTSFDVKVEGCRVEGYGSYGSFGKLVGTHTTTPDISHQEIRVVNNRIADTKDYGVRALNWRNFVISGNHFVNCNGAVQADMGTAGTSSSWWQSQTESGIIANNTVDGSGALNGGPSQKTAVIEVSGRSGSIAMENSIVSNNIIRNWTNNYGVYMSYANECSVNGNVLKYNPTSGTAIGVLNSSGPVIADNNIRYAGSGIVTTGSTSTFISNNRYV